MKGRACSKKIIAERAKRKRNRRGMEMEWRTMEEEWKGMEKEWKRNGRGMEKEWKKNRR
jgi:hypothetical protein